MKALTCYILRDKTQHNSINDALNHCDEMMGAEMRDITDQLNPMNNFLHRTMLDIVANKKYDNNLREYIAWRNEHNELLNFDEMED